MNFSQWLQLERIIPWLFALLLFTLPISSTGKSVCLILCALAVLVMPSYRLTIYSLLKKPWCQAGLLLFAIAVLGCLFSPASLKEKGIVIEKYSKLLYLPLLVVGFREPRTRTLGLHAYLAAIVLVCVLSILKFYGFLNFLAINPERVFRNHIITGFMVAFAAYLAILLAYRQTILYKRLAYSLLALLFSYQVIFVNGGRSGYLIYLLMMGILLLQLCSWRQALIGMLGLIAIFGLAYLQSSMVQLRVNSLTNEFLLYQQATDKNTSLGFRLQFFNYAHELFNKHPLLGNGTASFTYHFRTEKPIPAWGETLLEPHNQYWLVAAEFGLLGLGILLFFFATLMMQSAQLLEYRSIAFAILIPFLVGNLSDSLLFYSGPGYLFLFVIALCFGEQLQPKPMPLPLGILPTRNRFWCCL